MGKGYRQGRLGEEIRKIISQMLIREVKDPRLSENMITVSEVNVTRDGSYANCYISIMATGNDEEKTMIEQDVMEGLESAKGLFKKEIGKEIRLRHVPELVFKMDRSLEYGMNIQSVLDSLNLHEKESEDDLNEE